MKKLAILTILSIILIISFSVSTQTFEEPIFKPHDLGGHHN